MTVMRMKVKHFIYEESRLYDQYDANLKVEKGKTFKKQRQTRKKTTRKTRKPRRTIKKSIKKKRKTIRKR